MRLQATLCPALCCLLPAPAPTEKPQTCLLRLPILLATFKCSSAEFERHRGQEPGQLGRGPGGSAAEKGRPLQIHRPPSWGSWHTAVTPLFPAAALLVPRRGCRPANPQRERARRTAGYPATVYCGRQCGPPRPPHGKHPECSYTHIAVPIKHRRANKQFCERMGRGAYMLTQVTLRMPPLVGPHRLSPGPNPVPMPLQRTCKSTARTHCCEAFSRLPLEARRLQHTMSASHAPPCSPAGPERPRTQADCPEGRASAQQENLCTKTLGPHITGGRGEGGGKPRGAGLASWQTPRSFAASRAGLERPEPSALGQAHEITAPGRAFDPSLASLLAPRPPAPTHPTLLSHAASVPAAPLPESNPMRLSNSGCTRPLPAGHRTQRRPPRARRRLQTHQGTVSTALFTRSCAANAEPHSQPVRNS